jgi:hypothetical protein
MGIRTLPFFTALHRRGKKKDHIKQLKDPTGVFVEGTDLLNPIIENYFTNMFATDNPSMDLNFLEKVIPRVTVDMNTKLMAPFLVDDVKKAVFSIGDLKAPGPDGLHAIFYKSFGTSLGRTLHDLFFRQLMTK